MGSGAAQGTSERNEERARIFMEHARKSLVEVGHLQEVAFLYTGDKMAHVALGGIEEIDSAIRAIETLRSRLMADTVILLSAAYPQCPLGEAILLTVLATDESGFQMMQPFNRDQEGKVISFGEVEVWAG